MLRTRQQRPSKPAAHLKPLARRHRQYRLGEIRLQLVKHRLPQARRRSPCHALHHSAQRIPVLARLLDALNHPRRHILIRAARDIRLHIRRRHRVRIHIRRQPPNLLHIPHYLNAIFLRQPFLSDSPRRNAPYRLPSARPTSPLPIAYPKLGVISIIGVRRPINPPHMLIIFAARVAIPNAYQYRRPQRFPLKHPRKYLRPIPLLALCGNLALPRPPPIQLPLNIPLAQPQPRRAAVHRHPHRIPMRLPPRRNPKHPPKSIAHSSTPSLKPLKPFETSRPSHNIRAALTYFHCVSYHRARPM